MKHLLLTIFAVVLLAGCVNSETRLSSAVASGDIKVAKRAILAGANVNARNSIGRTFLHSAALGGHKEIIELLIANDADVNAKILSFSHKGKTPLDFVVAKSRKEVYDLLRKHGAKTSAELKAEVK